MMIGSALYPKRAMSAAGTPIASQSTTVTTAAITPTGYTADPAVDGVKEVTFDVQNATVRARWDGTPASATVGHLLYAGTNYTWDTQQYNACSFFRDTLSTADAIIFASPLQ